jgi:hypothetical protein
MGSSHRKPQRRRIRLPMLMIQPGQLNHLAIHHQPRMPINRFSALIRRPKAHLQHNLVIPRQQSPRNQRSRQTRIQPAKPPSPAAASPLRGPHGVIHGDTSSSRTHPLNNLRQRIFLNRLGHPSQRHRPHKQNDLAHRRHQPPNPAGRPQATDCTATYAMERMRCNSKLIT